MGEREERREKEEVYLGWDGKIRVVIIFVNMFIYINIVFDKSNFNYLICMYYDCG